jgi:iron complex transport system substrate-binding protein
MRRAPLESPRSVAFPPRCAEAAGAWLAAFGAPTAAPAALGIAFAPTTYKEVLDGALALGRAAGRLPEAMRVLAEGEARLRRLRDRLGLARPDRAREGLPRVAVIERHDPLTLAGRWVPDLVAHAGGRPVLVEPGQPSAAVPMATLAATEPDVLVVAPLGHTKGDVRAALRALERLPGWDRLAAVRGGRVFVIEGTLLYPPGPGLVAAAEQLAAALHPERFPEPEANHRR